MATAPIHAALQADRQARDAMAADVADLRQQVAALAVDREQQRQTIERLERRLVDVEAAAQVTR